MKKLLISILTLSILLTGCQTKSKIEFNSEKELSSYYSKTVSINGFLAGVDTDLKTGYLVPSPYKYNIDFKKNEKKLINCILFSMPNSKSYESTYMPITVTGTLVKKDLTDKMGYSVTYYIKDATVKEYKADKNTDLYVYSELQKMNFVNKFDDYMSTVYDSCTSDSPTLLDSTLFSDLYDSVSEQKDDSFDTPRQLIIDSMALVKNINDSIVAGDSDSMDAYTKQGKDLYTKFYKWLRSITF
jgi:hypothetical protein